VISGITAASDRGDPTRSKGMQRGRRKSRESQPDARGAALAPSAHMKHRTKARPVAILIPLCLLVACAPAHSDEASDATGEELRPPSQLTATSVSPTSVLLAWQDNSRRERSYLLERSASSAGDGFVELASLPPNTTTYTDTGVVGATDYWYRVSA